MKSNIHNIAYANFIWEGRLKNKLSEEENIEW